jgi:cytochrome c553
MVAFCSVFLGILQTARNNDCPAAHASAGQNDAANKRRLCNRCHGRNMRSAGLLVINYLAL